MSGKPYIVGAGMQQRINTILAGAFLLVVAVTLFVLASQIQRRIPIGVDSGFFPEIASAALGLLAAIIFIQGLRTQSNLRMEAVAPKGQRAVVLSLALIIAFGAGMATLGFLPATALYLLAQFYVLSPPDQRRPTVFALIALGSAVAIQFIFIRGFGLVLPAGMWS